VFLISFFPVSPASGADIKGGKDSPLLRRYEGSFIVQYEAKEYDGTVIPLGKTAYRDGRYVFTASEKAEGGTTRLLYVAPAGRSALEEMAKLLKAFPDLRVLIVGHTDSTGDREYTTGLSRRRAEAVVKSLRERYGIAASRLIPAGVGMLAPVASNRTAEGGAKNRRVELVGM
jgi:hypothetical protein